MYDDHLEIINPGILHFDITPEKLTRPHESKPWNPIIASVFYRAGVIEKWGMGTLNIIDWCKENGNPKPTWEVRAESVVTTFLPSVFFATGEMPEERPKLRPKSIEEEVISLLRKGHLSKAEIAEYVVISGCSGGGKSTLLSELVNRGYSVVLEPGRQIVKEQTAIGGDALPWINLQRFLELALPRYLFQFNSQRESHKFIFFDRGIIDAVQLDQPQAEYFQNAAKKFKYNRLVFLVPPWEEIFTGDRERKHNFESAKKEFDELLIKYKNFGYETVLITKIGVEERADFILEKLGAF